MKGISHFAVGLAVTSCFPEAVRAAEQGNPLYFILGGAFGLLPDTLDFKFYRFVYRHDVEVQPDPLRPNAQMIAEAVAGAVNRAWETKSPVRIKLNTVRLGTDRWQRYLVTFDVPGRRVLVRYGPEVDTGNNPLPGGPPPRAGEGVAPLTCDVRLDYQAETAVDIFDGPLFKMTPGPDGRVCPEFIAWHREWSHSLVVSALFGAAGAVVWGPLAGLVIAGAYAAHALVDQLGHMGSALFFPFSRVRRAGLRLTHSGDPFPNFAAVWLSCMLIFWNLLRAMPWHPGLFAGLKVLLLGGVLPLALYRVLVGRATTTS